MDPCDGDQGPSPTDRTHDDNWHGTYHELAIKLVPADDSRLGAALTTLWDEARLGEPFRRDGAGDVSVTAAALLDGHVNSVANIPGLGSTLTSVIVVREEVDDAERAILGNDWLDLCLPLGGRSATSTSASARIRLMTAPTPRGGVSRSRTGLRRSRLPSSRRSLSPMRSRARRYQVSSRPSRRLDA